MIKKWLKDEDIAREKLRYLGFIALDTVVRGGNYNKVNRALMQLKRDWIDKKLPPLTPNRSFQTYSLSTSPQTKWKSGYIRSNG